MRQRQPEALHESDRLGSAREQRLGADVDREVADPLLAQLAADAVRALQDHDVRAGLGEVERGGETGDARADDRDAHQCRS